MDHHGQILMDVLKAVRKDTYMNVNISVLTPVVQIHQLKLLINYNYKIHYKQK